MTMSVTPKDVVSVSKMAAVLQAVRLPTLLVGISPILLGSSFGMYQLVSQNQVLRLQNWLVLCACLITVLCFQAAANLVNDVKDAESGVDNAATRVGPTRVVAAGQVSASYLKKVYGLLFIIGMGSTLAVTSVGGWPIFILGIVCVVFAYAYTAGPWPLSHRGLGELVAFIFFGPAAVGGCYYLQTSTISYNALLLGAGPGFLSAAVMAINNFRDREQDYLSGKKTLANRLPIEIAERLPWFFVLAGIFSVSVVYLSFLSYGLTIFLSALLIIIAHLQIKPWLKPSPLHLNRALKQTTIFEFIFTLIFIGSLWG